MIQEVPKEEDLLELIPKAGFVVKTKLEESTVDPPKEKGTKVFLNICSGDDVPLPKVEYDPEIIYPLIMDNKWEIPIVTSDMRVDKDKKGNLAYVYDCIINTKSMRWIQMDKELREILIEWCLESAELRSDISLSRANIVTPKLKSKGEIPSIKILKADIDLNRLNKEFEERVKKLEHDPISILEGKRYENELENEEIGNIDIFNINRKVSTKPLIQEIENMSISKKETNLKVVELKQQKKEEKRDTRELLKYETTMKKVDINGYKLKIEISSQNQSSLDYELVLDKDKNDIILKNLNPKYSTKKDLVLPLPNIFTNPSFKSFFIAKDSKLIIFIK